jgi:hypothetical protein
VQEMEGIYLYFVRKMKKKKIIKKLEKYGCSARDFYYQESGLNIS